MSFLLEQAPQKIYLPESLFNDTNGSISGPTFGDSGCLDCDDVSGKGNSFEDQFTTVVIVIGALFSVFYMIGIASYMCYLQVTKDPRYLFGADQSGANSSPSRRNKAAEDEEWNCI